MHTLNAFSIGRLINSEEICIGVIMFFSNISIFISIYANTLINSLFDINERRNKFIHFSNYMSLNDGFLSILLRT